MTFMGEPTLNNTIVPDFTQVLRPKADSSPKEMLSVEQDGEQTRVRINSSSLSVIQTCPRKTKLSLHEKWKGKQGSPPLIFGSAIHKALEVFYAHSCKERELPIDFDEVAPLLADGKPAPTKHFLYDALEAFVVAAEPLRILPDTDKRSIASGIWVLTHYFKTYLHDVYVIHTDENGPIIERTFSLPFYEDKTLQIELFGTIDFVLRNEATGELLPGDHKTTSQLGIDFLNRVKPNHQYTAYIIGAQRALGLQGENFMINGIQTKARPLTSRGSGPNFTRQITRRTAEDIKEFEASLLWSVRSYLNWRETNSWPLGNVDACAMWGGCPYLEVCSAPNELRQNILEAKFAKEN